MSTVGMVFWGVVAVACLMAVSSPARRFFRSIGLWAGGQADKAAENIANADPLAVYNSQVETAAEAGRNASKVVEAAAGQLVSLERQINTDLGEQARLTNRLKAVVESGDPNNTAEGYALDLERVERNLEVNRSQLTVAQKQYDDNMKLVTDYENQVTTARKRAADLGFQLKSSEAAKDFQRLSGSLNTKLNLGDLAEAERRVQAKIDQNNGAIRAGVDLNQTANAQKADDELERKARAQAVLDRFKKPASPMAVANDVGVPR